MKVEDKRIAALEERVQEQQAIIELLLEFCRSVANKENLSLLSYQQIYSPSADSSDKVRMLLKKIGEFG